MEEQIGVIIEQGPKDWQIVQQDHRVELVLERPLQGVARGHDGYGKDPATVPADMERFLPMLGFEGVEIM